MRYFVENSEDHKIILYHGSNKFIDNFDITKVKVGDYGKGFYFAENSSVAKIYGPKITKVLVSVENPFDFFNTPKDEILKLATKLGINSEVEESLQFYDEWGSANVAMATWELGYTALEMSKGFDQPRARETIAKIVQKMGYDAIIFPYYEDKSRTWVIFDSNKIEIIGHEYIENPEDDFCLKCHEEGHSSIECPTIKRGKLSPPQRKPTPVKPKRSEENLPEKEIRTRIESTGSFDIDSINSKVWRDIDKVYKDLGGVGKITDKISIIFSGRMSTKAGMYKDREKEIHFNKYLLKNPKNYEETAYHEWAHAIQMDLFEEWEHHGKEWQGIMKRLNQPIEEFHTIDVAEVAPEKFQKIKCSDCDYSISLTDRKLASAVKKIERRGAKYKCPKCLTSLNEEILTARKNLISARKKNPNSIYEIESEDGNSWIEEIS